MQRPPSILILAIVSSLGSLVFMANTVAGNGWLINSILSPPSDSEGSLIPIANAIGKDLMLDVSPQLHPSVLVGNAGKGIKFLHWIDNDIHCEDCLRLEIPNNGKQAGAAFSPEGAVYNFEGAKKVRFYVMGEEAGAKVRFKAVGNDKGNNNAVGATKGNSSNGTDLFTSQNFALTSQNVTLNQTWNYLEMNLEGVQKDLGKVKYPFGFELAQGKGKATTVMYLKGIMYSSEPVQNQYLLEPSSANDTSSSLASPMAAAKKTPLNITLSDDAAGTLNAPAKVEFHATVSNGQKPYSFYWNFDDSGEVEQDSDGNISHTFATGGSYNVTVNVTDSTNNRGSASTVVDVVDEIVNDQAAEASKVNSTQNSDLPDAADSKTANASASAQVEDDTEETDITNREDSLNEDNRASEDSSLNSTEATDDRRDEPTTSNTEPNSSKAETAANVESNEDRNTNSPPIANAGADLIGMPNGQVILDGSKSSDPDSKDVIQLYQWKQESGPAAQIHDNGSPTPTVTLPNVDHDSTVVFSLTVNDGKVNSDEDSVSIYVPHIDELTDTVQQKVLRPVGVAESGWTPSEGCHLQGDGNCLSDASDATFVVAQATNTGSTNLYKFGKFVGEEQRIAGSGSNSLIIDRVVAEITAKKLGNTAYISFAADDSSGKNPHFTPSVSIVSNSFQAYSQVWDANPVTGKKWTLDSLNSLTAGFRYDGGQSGVEVSEIQLTVNYHLVEAAAPAAPAAKPAAGPSDDLSAAGDSNDVVSNQDRGDGENDRNQDTDTHQVRDNTQDEPTRETDANTENDSEVDNNNGAEDGDTSESED